MDEMELEETRAKSACRSQEPPAPFPESKSAPKGLGVVKTTGGLQKPFSPPQKVQGSLKPKPGHKKFHLQSVRPGKVRGFTELYGMRRVLNIIC